jgi:uncharacterized protein
VNDPAPIAAAVPSTGAPTADDLEREARLLALLRATGGVLVAFSGGVDSSYLLWAATTALGRDRARAVMGLSASVSAAQRAQAEAVAALLGVAIEPLATRETEDPRYLANRGDRCFFCKDELYARIGELVVDGDRPVVDGTNADDVGGHRPGAEAARLRLVRSPLLEVGLGKAAIRRLSRRAALPTADVPATPCLASRFPAGVPVTEEGLRRVEAAEARVRARGFAEFRVRHHGDVARLELSAEDLPRMLDPALRAGIDADLRAAGYRFVAVDLAPFASGRGSTTAV